MQWIKDSLILGSVTVGMTGALSLMMPGNASAALIGGTTGSFGAAIATAQQNRRIKKLLQESQVTTDALTLLKTQLEQTEHKATQINDWLTTSHTKITAVNQQVEKLEQWSTRQKRPQPVPPNTIPTYHSQLTVVSASDNSLEANQEAIAWFAAKGIEVENCYQPDPILAPVFDALADYLGNHYVILADLYRRMKASFGKGFHYSLQDKSQREISICTEFCKKLQTASFLSYSYSSTDKLIWARPQQKAEVTHFLTGEWLERFVYRTVSGLLKTHSLNYQCLRNPKVRFSNGDRFELDLFFLVEGQPLWIECKTGRNHDMSLERYVNHRQRLELPESRAILVALDLPEDAAQIRTQMWKLTVTNQENFVLLIHNFLNAIVSTPVAQPEASESSALNPKLLNLFKGQRIYSTPEHRQNVIQVLIDYFDQSSQSITFVQLSQLVKTTLAETMSNTKLHAVLRLIRLAGCLLDDEQNPVLPVNASITALASLKADVLESKCIEFYAAKVRERIGPGFFDNEQNELAFEHILGGKVPDS